MGEWASAVGQDDEALAGGDAEAAVAAGSGSCGRELCQMEFESGRSSGDQVAMTTGGAIVLVATPIGNLGDLSPRAV